MPGDERPLLLVGPCKCLPDCKSIRIGIFKSYVMEIDDDLVPYTIVADTDIQDVIDMIRRAAKEQGVKVK